MSNISEKKGFGVAAVFFTAIATILGAILFLRFGYAVGSLGIFGVLLIIVLGHLVTIPTALALSEIATNQKVEGGGEYFIISRSFGLNIGSTIGIALFFSQAASVAFYVIGFTEAFSQLFDWFKGYAGIELPRQVVSIPALAILSYLILKKGANMGVAVLYIVVGILFISLLLFFLGTTEYATNSDLGFFGGSFRNMDNFFIVFAIIFPAFTGMTAGVGLSGELRNPSKSIPLGSIAATILGMIIYVFLTWKFAISASPNDLMNDQMIMAKIAIGGAFIIPIGLAASTISSAIGSVMVAPRTLQALAKDNSFPLAKVNSFLSKEKKGEPFNATTITLIIAFVFVLLGDINAVAKIISMFFMITYGSLNLISFLHHFGADPSYRPTFKTKKILSLVGFILSVWLMFMMNSLYAIAAIIIMTAFYFIISYIHKDRGGFQEIFQAVVFQIIRKIQVFAQRASNSSGSKKWRPSAVCISERTFQNDKTLSLLSWISDTYGFGTYIHLILDYFSLQSQQQAENLQEEILQKEIVIKSSLFIDTLISPSYTSAIAQTIQLPSVSGLKYNMLLFEYPKDKPEELTKIIENVRLSKTANMDVCIYQFGQQRINYKDGIHIWIQPFDIENANMMILLAYIIHAHPDWKKSMIKVTVIVDRGGVEKNKEDMISIIENGRLPISKNKIEIIERSHGQTVFEQINSHPIKPGLHIIGFDVSNIRQTEKSIIAQYKLSGDILFVNSSYDKEIH